MSDESSRTFFHEFCNKFAASNYSTFVRPPAIPEEIKAVTDIYGLLGCTGCDGILTVIKNFIALKDGSLVMWI